MSQGLKSRGNLARQQSGVHTPGRKGQNQRPYTGRKPPSSQISEEVSANCKKRGGRLQSKRILEKQKKADQKGYVETAKNSHIKLIKHKYMVGQKV